MTGFMTGICNWGYGPRIANAIKDNLDDEDDKLTKRYITNLIEIILYINVKYIRGVNIIDTTLGSIRKLKTPNNDEQCINAIELVLPLSRRFGFLSWKTK